MYNPIRNKSHTERKRLCVKCKERKNFSNFPPSLHKQAYVTGVSSICKECFPEYRRKVLNSRAEKKLKSIASRIESEKRKILKIMLKIKELKALEDEINSERKINNKDSSKYVY